MKKSIIISPYSQKLKTGRLNPKNYPYWPEVISRLSDDYSIIQIGVKGEDRFNGVHEFITNLPLNKLALKLKEVGVFVSVDNFLPHFCQHLGVPGVVIFAQSDPNIFGYNENINLLKNRIYLRKNQFGIWEESDYRADSFIEPHAVISAVKQLIKNVGVITNDA